MAATVITDLENVFSINRNPLKHHESTALPTDSPRYQLETANWATPERYYWHTDDGTAVELYVERFYQPIGWHQHYGRYVLTVDGKPIKITSVKHMRMTDGTCRDSKVTYVTSLGKLVVELIPDVSNDENHTFGCTWIEHSLTLVPNRCSGLRCLYRTCTKPLVTPEGQCSIGHVDDDYDGEPPDSWN